MRLTCPNCSAQYEVDERVIPQNGRDVQCSACGHTWYQYPMEVALQMRASDLDEDEDEDDDLPAPPADGTARPNTPRIDKTVLDVLREEAERELSERKRAQAGLETQEELGLVRRPARSKAAPSRIYGEADPDTPPPPPEMIEEDAAPEAPKTPRRALLPDIEELTSTLEPGTEKHRDDDEDENERNEQRSFRRGVSTVMLIALALVVLYLLAPLIASWVPATEGVLRAYVGLIDGLRTTAATLMRGLFS